MRSYDALVVGGGPGGSSCARSLSQAGLDVLVMDRAAFPRDKVCAGWVTPAVLTALQVDLDEYQRGRTLQAITGFRTSRMGGPTVETHYGWPVSFGIRRCEFDHYLLERSGARLRTGAPVTAIRRADGQWIVNEDVKARILVGAGGHFCPVARLLGGGGGQEPIVAAQEIELELSPALEAGCPVSGERPELFFSADLKGYGWCVRKGRVLNVGFGRLGRERLTGHVEAFLDFLKERGRIPDGFPSRFKGHAYLLYQTTPRQLLDDGVLLVGDAAGLAYAQSGEGIRTAVESGLMAAATILVAGGRYRREDLEPYERKLEARFGHRARPHPLGKLPPRLVSSLADFLLRRPWFVRHVVLDRWFLHAHQPALPPAPAPQAGPATTACAPA